MDKKIFGKIKKFLPLIGIIIFLYIIYSLNIEKIVNAFLSIHPLYIIFALALNLPRLIIRNFAWQLIIKEQKIPLAYLLSLKIFLMGMFYGSITPGYLGQLMRIPYMKEKTSEPYGKLFVNTVIEIIVHNMSLYAMMIVGAILVIGRSFELFSITIIWIGIVLIIVLFVIKKERGEKLFFTLIRYLVPNKLKNDFNKFVSTFYTDFPRIKKLFLPVFIGFLTWIIIFSQEYIIVYSLGVEIPYIYFLFLFPIANAAGFIPITFAGLGTREITSIFLFSTLFNAEVEKIFVFTLVGFIVTDIFTGFIGFILSLTESLKRKELTNIIN